MFDLRIAYGVGFYPSQAEATRRDLRSVAATRALYLAGQDGQGRQLVVFSPNLVSGLQEPLSSSSPIQSIRRRKRSNSGRASNRDGTNCNSSSKKLSGTVAIADTSAAGGGISPSSSTTTTITSALTQSTSVDSKSGGVATRSTTAAAAGSAAAAAAGNAAAAAAAPTTSLMYGDEDEDVQHEDGEAMRSAFALGSHGCQEQEHQKEYDDDSSTLLYNHHLFEDDDRGAQDDDDDHDHVDGIQCEGPGDAIRGSRTGTRHDATTSTKTALMGGSPVAGEENVGSAAMESLLLYFVQLMDSVAEREYVMLLCAGERGESGEGADGAAGASGGGSGGGWVSWGRFSLLGQMHSLLPRR